jgi:hypothetical protein
MHEEAERSSSVVAAGRRRVQPATWNMPVDVAEKQIEKPAAITSCNQAPPPARVVMLHLRARYVSKAAILTVPAPLVPVENRSPA